MEFGTSFNSKLLLFGEYGLMFDAMALSVPFPKFSGKLALDPEEQHRQSTEEIRKFSDHVRQADISRNPEYVFDLEKLDDDLKKGLYFRSNIPQQYGVGSSGALVAALFSNYGHFRNPAKIQNPKVLKSIFAQFEGFFHGRSSGLDPLISFLNKPILIDSRKQVLPVNFDLSEIGVSMALIDTQTTGATGPLVQHFIDRFNDPEFEKVFESQFIPANNGCLNTLLNGDRTLFFGHLERLIRFQLQYFRRMIPEKFHSVILEALDEQVFIKLLGSGGGGFLLAITNTRKQIERFASRRNLDTIYI